jgi:preprotein translocase subunit SecY
MNGFMHKIRLVIGDAVLMKRIFFTATLLIVFRFLAVIPIPGIDTIRLEQFVSGNDFFGLLNIFSGGGLSNLSIVMLGVSPSITASIIMQLLTVMWPRLKEMYQEEGEMGRRKFSQYSRLLTVPLAFVQGYSFMALLQSQGVLAPLAPFELLTNLIIIAAGSMLIMWMGELITEFGLGNGLSLIIFAGIVSSLPGSISRLFLAFDPSQIPAYVGFAVVTALVIWGVVVINEADRPIPVTYAKQVRGNKVYGGVSTYLPLKVNQSGVIPLIFAISIITFPQMILGFLVNVNNEAIKSFATSALALLTNQAFYGALYFFLVFIFTYFYTAVTFDPDSISKNLQRSGAFIPGVRPGSSTSSYISNILFRLTMVGALFLGAIAVLPIAIGALTGISAVAIGGTGILIVVSVVIDLVKKIDTQVSAREY